MRKHLRTMGMWWWGNEIKSGDIAHSVEEKSWTIATVLHTAENLWLQSHFEFSFLGTYLDLILTWNAGSVSDRIWNIFHLVLQTSTQLGRFEVHYYHGYDISHNLATESWTESDYLTVLDHYRVLAEYRYEKVWLELVWEILVFMYTMNAKDAINAGNKINYK